ncbi:hypothetical protein [Mycetocola miduiensis]|uniref:Uncharacterized protein n=1 Tax=Mycetocola miduiensis TaxID=995034 RepID=A0A1I5CC89_9MICO|nr:hypothetical protein [Mycetocola miduiensis]SFN84494.1 hypothetical protein SAMN05216219_2335 [Mycetocola miduiensis]
MIENDGGVSGFAPGELSRVLDLLDQQRRRILELSALVSAGRRELLRSTGVLSWRSPARLEFDSRLSDVHRVLASGSNALQVALAECNRACDLVRSGLAAEGAGIAAGSSFVGLPARGAR